VPNHRHVRHVLVWVGLAVSALFTYLAVRNIDWEVFWDALQTNDWWWTIPSLLVLGACVLLRAYRWGLLFQPSTRPSYRTLVSSLLICYLFNNILPARAGEAARVVAVNQREGTSRVEAVGTIAGERVYDIFALLILLFVGLPFLPDVTWLERAAILAIALAVVVLGFVLAMYLWGDRPIRAALRPLSRLPRVSVGRTDRAAENLVQGLVALRHFRIALPVLAATVASWLLLALSAWLLMIGFDLGLPFGAGLLVVIATNLAMILPSSPAAVGVFEAATQVALRAYGVSSSEALSYAIVLHAVNFFPYLILGYVALHRHASLLRRRRATSAPAPAHTPASSP
jgi:uncharacterized protein (TIRG00374 family)